MKLNDICEYNLPYPLSAFTHNPGTTITSQINEISDPV